MITNNVDQLMEAFDTSFSDCISSLDETLPSDVQDYMSLEHYAVHNHIISGRGADGTIIDTGKLHDSIQGVNAVEKGVYSAIVGTDNEYATWVHEGGWIEARPFLEDSITENKDTYLETIRQAFEDAIYIFN